MPGRVRKQLEQTLADTAHFTDSNLSLALNYGSRTEVVDAVKSYALACQRGDVDPEKIDWETFASHLYTADLPDPDLVIRTSGEHSASAIFCSFSRLTLSISFQRSFGPSSASKIWRQRFNPIDNVSAATEKPVNR